MACDRLAYATNEMRCMLGFSYSEIVIYSIHRLLTKKINCVFCIFSFRPIGRPLERSTVCVQKYVQYNKMYQTIRLGSVMLSYINRKCYIRSVFCFVCFCFLLNYRQLLCVFNAVNWNISKYFVWPAEGERKDEIRVPIGIVSTMKRAKIEIN